MFAIMGDVPRQLLRICRRPAVPGTLPRFARLMTRRWRRQSVSYFFTSLLRLELIANVELRQRAAAILARRDIFTPPLS
ncbi:Uncharacterized protein conserved in bacteria [Raoultella planticola]|uniref:Uncharacterized protein conserved in bacteria n=1 Tax=Raoultella planticola TaxID=575 RepID=A0A485CQ23_RAOPL|nr:Uncharacterized protein conserved in bacteria [Raoultella planticola]